MNLEYRRWWRPWWPWPWWQHVERPMEADRISTLPDDVLLERPLQVDRISDLPGDVLLERPLQVDRISSLPGYVLLHIIYRLPVVQWASLSAVSLSWRHCFSLLPRHGLLDLHVSYPHQPLPPGAFPRALLQRCHIVYRTSVSPGTQLKLLRDASSVCVRELILEKAESPHLGFKTVIPEFVLSIKSLTELKLIGCFLNCGNGVPQPSRIAIGCKHLKILHIESSFIAPFALEDILARCLVLETLFLAHPLGLRGARICSRSLKHLQLILREGIFRIDVHTPQLKILSLQKRVQLWGQQHEQFDLKIRAPQTQEVLFDFTSPSQTWLSPLGMKWFLRTAQDLTSMKLSGAALQILAAGCWEDKLDFSFKKLASLSVSLDIAQTSQTDFLVKLLEVCPSLSKLDLKVAHGQGEGDIEVFQKHLFDRVKTLNCISYHLVLDSSVRYN